MHPIPFLFLFVIGLWWAPAVGHAQVSSPAPYVSEMRDECVAEMAKDAHIRAQCLQQYTDEVREQDFRQSTEDKRHVVMAYVALWGIVTIFVMALWLRQRKLTQEITRLEADLEKVAAQ